MNRCILCRPGMRILGFVHIIFLFQNCNVFCYLCAYLSMENGDIIHMQLADFVYLVQQNTLIHTEGVFCALKPSLVKYIRSIRIYIMYAYVHTCMVHIQYHHNYCVQVFCSLHLLWWYSVDHIIIPTRWALWWVWSV